jgi:hypothetical protein
MWSSSYITVKFCQVLLPSSAVFYQCRNITPPPSVKACPQALYIRTMPIGRSYLYTLPVAYYLYYTSILSIYLGTLAVLVY